MEAVVSREVINEWVRDYKNGNEGAIDGIFEAVRPIIEESSRELEPYVTVFTKFDCSVIKKLRRLAKTFNEGEHDFMSAAKAIILREKADFFKRRSDIDSEISKELLEGEDEEELGYQFEDVSADVEAEVLYKEKVDLLAQDDERKKVVLEHWTKGASDSSISELLAQLFGGKSESHRKFVRRFRKECQRILSVEMSIDY